jgi:hypothetical protein
MNRESLLKARLKKKLDESRKKLLLMRLSSNLWPGTYQAVRRLVAGVREVEAPRRPLANEARANTVQVGVAAVAKVSVDLVMLAQNGQVQFLIGTVFTAIRK